MEEWKERGRREGKPLFHPSILPIFFDVNAVF
jgi:hypothetical protein